MESDEMQLQELLSRSKKVFDKHNGRVTVGKFKKVLAVINVTPEDKHQLQEFFDAVDQDGDGYISYEDFKQTFIQPMMEEEDSVDRNEMQELSAAEQSLLTLEKLSEFKNMYEYHHKGKLARIMDMRDDIVKNQKGFLIKISEFDAFFKDFVNEEMINEEEFYELYNYYEQKVFEKASVFQNTPDGFNQEIDVEVDDEELDLGHTPSQDIEEVVIGEAAGEESDDDDHDEKDPEVGLQDIVDHVVDSGNITRMKPDQLNKLIRKIKNKVDKVNVKVQKLETKNEKYKNRYDVLKNEKDYFKRKIEDLKTKNEELKEAKYKLECDVEDLMKFEQDFQRMVKQCEDKDVELMKLEDEVEAYQRKNRQLEMKLRQ